MPFYLVFSQSNTYLPKNYFGIWIYQGNGTIYLFAFVGRKFVMYCACPVYFILSSQCFELGGTGIIAVLHMRRELQRKIN